MKRCENCGMCWTERVWSWDELLGKIPMGEGTLREPHVCPEPYTREQAQWYLDAIIATGAIVHQRTKARIKLGLGL